MAMLQLSLEALVFFSFSISPILFCSQVIGVLFPLLLQFADFCKIASVFAFQIKEWFQLNMLQAHLLVINNC